MRKVFFFTIIISILLSCNITPINEDKDLGVLNIEIPKTLLPQGERKETFLLLTNPTPYEMETPKVVVNRAVSKNLKVKYRVPEYIEKKSKNLQPTNLYSNIKTQNLASREIISYEGYAVGDSATFYLESEEATLPFILQSRTTNSEWELFIWSDTPTKDIPKESIEFLVNNFIEINSYMSAIFGEHWGKQKYSNLLKESNKDIHIILTDIHRDKNANKDLIFYGYFNPLDAYTDLAQSNQCLNIVIDSYNFFGIDYNSSGELVVNYSWTPLLRSSVRALSTMIHEYQHIIHFYNKFVIGGKQDIYVNEMFSMLAEEILSNKFLGYIKLGTQLYLTPDLIRIPHFNSYWDLSSNFYWDESATSSVLLTQYSKAYTMGAYLIRNYGLEFIREYMKGTNIGKDGILDSLNTIDPMSEHTSTTILQNFGSAILYGKSYENSKKVPYKFNNSIKIDVLDMEFDLKALDIFNQLTYGVPFETVTVSDFNTNYSNKNFKPEFNIYIDLGSINNEDTLQLQLNSLTTEVKYCIIF